MTTGRINQVSRDEFAERREPKQATSRVKFKGVCFVQNEATFVQQQTEFRCPVRDLSPNGLQSRSQSSHGEQSPSSFDNSVLASWPSSLAFQRQASKLAAITKNEASRASFLAPREQAKRTDPLSTGRASAQASQAKSITRVKQKRREPRSSPPRQAEKSDVPPLLASFL